MRHLVKISILIIIMTLTTATASADKYSRAWKNVENYIKEDLPESAATEINRIWDMAAEDGDGRQMLKSAAYLTQVQQTYGENSITQGIELFQTLLPNLRVKEHKAICHAFLAKGYMKYWDLNRYNTGRNLPSDEVNPPLQHWTPKMICDTICYHLDQSIQLAGDVAAGYYEEFFPGGNKAGQKLRPLLVDMLMDNAIMLITDYRLPLGKRKFLDNSGLYGNMGSFLEATRGLTPDDPDMWQFYVLRQLVNNNFASKPSIRCTIDIRRMQVLNSYLDNDGKWDRNDEEWLKGAVALAQSYTKKVKFSTMLYSMAAQKIEDNLYVMPVEKASNLRRQAHDICIAAQRKWPKSEGALECMGIKAEIEQKSVNFDFRQDFLPGERNIARLDYCNVSTVYIKVVEVPSQLKADDESTLLSQINQCNAVSEWSMSLNDPGDFMEHHSMINIPPVMQGCYYLMVSTGPYFNRGDCIAYRYIECNGIQFVRLIQNNGTLYGVAVDTRTGKPIPDCKFTLWKLNNQGDQVQVATSGITGTDGVVLLENYNNGRFKIELESGNSRGNATFYLPWSSDMPDTYRYARLYTDRFTYLPGDSVQFTGVVYTRTNDKGEVLPGQEVTVYANGSRDEELVGTYTTDEMGVFHGSYKIADNYMPGRIRFRTELDRGGYATSNGWTQINVESFRQPKFEVILDKFKDDIDFDTQFTITGRAITYTDIPVDGASVTWYAGVSPYTCHRLCIPDERGYVRVGAGQVKTSADGTFSFSLSVPSEIMLENSGRVFVNAIVTDINGETHESSTNLSVGNGQTKYINIDAGDGSIGLDGEKALRFSLYSANGLVSGRINVKVSRLEWLERPGLPLPFSLDSPRLKERLNFIKELSVAADNMNLKERFPRYDFDFNDDDIVERVVFEGVVPYDRDDKQSMELVLDGLQSGVYRITAGSEGFTEVQRDVTLCREDDYGFVPLKPLLWSYNGSGNRTTVEVGDTALIRLGNSRKGTIIHYYIENRYGVVKRGSIESNGSQQVLSIPVTDELKGYFSVSCAVLYEGVAQNTSFEFEVPDRDHDLKMELVTFRSLLEPDVDEEWQLHITDWQGNPVKAAILLDMYDRALEVYGTSSFILQPFSPVYVSGRTLLDWPYGYTSRYEYWLHSFNDKYEYKGKRAITGVLIDPFSYKSIRLREVKSINMEDFEALGITIVDEALAGKVASLDMVFDSGELGASSQMRLRGSAKESAPNMFLSMNEPDVIKEAEIEYEGVAEKAVQLRTDFNPTGLFRYIVTDSTGMASVRFRSPQLLTEWRIRGLSFTDSLKTAHLDTTLITSKLLMVEPASPRFLRQGDRMEFTVKVSNLTDKSSVAAVTMTLTDAVSGRALGIIEGGNKKNITLPAGGSANTSFTINVPDGLTAITYRLTARTAGHSDGMEETIPVLTNRTQVTQSLSLFNNGEEKRQFHFEVLDKPRSSTIADEQLTLEYSATPIWYAIQNLPVIIRLDSPSNLSLFYSMMGAAISQDLCRRYPVIREMLDEWKQLPVSAWQAQLERNEDLTGTLLEETPWVMANRSENDRLHALAVCLGSKQTDDAFEFALRRLIVTQNNDGGWSWIPGFESSMYITTQIMSGFGLMIENGIIEVTPDMDKLIKKGLSYLDTYFYKKFDVKEKPQTLNIDVLNYLLIRSYFQSYEFEGTTNASHLYFSRLAQIQDTHELGIMFRTMLALLMSRTGNQENAIHIAATLVERSLYDDEMGRYWRDNTGGFLWHEAPIETQSLIIRTLLATGYETQAVEAARWLLKQKQTTGWGSSPATASAVTALMATGSSAQLESDPDITIYVGKDAVKASTDKATAGYIKKTWQGPISSDKADVKVDAKTPGISWGAVYRTFTEQLDKVEHQENGMTLKRTVWRVIRGADGDRLEEVKPGTRLHVGDQLRVHFDLTTDRNLEYLQLIDMRAAAVEPLSTHAGYTYNWLDDIGYYSAPGNTRNVFYIDRLSKGSYAIEYDVKVQKPGRFTVGNAVMQCLYAPAFRATTTSITITVDN